ncbi:MAG: hypothetical protein RRY12_01295 [Cloacibacillus sp.]
MTKKYTVTVSEVDDSHSLDEPITGMQVAFAALYGFLATGGCVFAGYLTFKLFNFVAPLFWGLLPALPLWLYLTAGLCLGLFYSLPSVLIVCGWVKYKL